MRHRKNRVVVLTRRKLVGRHSDNLLVDVEGLGSSVRDLRRFFKRSPKNFTKLGFPTFRLSRSDVKLNKRYYRDMFGSLSVHTSIGQLNRVGNFCYTLLVGMSDNCPSTKKARQRVVRLRDILSRFAASIDRRIPD